MADYRVYLLDEANRTWDYRVISCDDDDAAMTMASELQSDLPGLEVWAGTRMVQRTTAGSPATPTH